MVGIGCQAGHSGQLRQMQMGMDWQMVSVTGMVMVEIGVGPLIRPMKIVTY